MKKSIIICLLFLTNSLFSQTRLSVDILGSSSVGLSFNAEQQFSISDNHKLSILAGLGGMIQGEAEPHWLYKGGAYYYFKSWGIGADFSVFNRIGETPTNSYSEMDYLIYPNVNYSWFLKNDLFIKLSFSMVVSHWNVINPDMNPQLNQQSYWEDIPVPFIGITIGKGLRKKE